MASLLPDMAMSSSKATLVALGTVAVATAANFSVQRYLVSKPSDRTYIPSPRKTLLSQLSTRGMMELPYPPNVMHGGRDVDTPYGCIKVFEWGPEEGEKVLLMHGINTPCLGLHDMASSLVSKGYRVMLFDFFGRGFSDAPVDCPYDMRLYTTQILLVLASSKLPWTGDNAFHLLGYSLGGGVAVAFSRYFPHMVRSLTLVAGGGLIRKDHMSTESRLLYSAAAAKWVPDFLIRQLVRWRLTPKRSDLAPAVVFITTTSPSDTAKGKQAGVTADAAERARKNLDVTGGGSFDGAVLSKQRPFGPTAAALLAWQLEHHQGFLPAFISSMRHAPIYEQWEDWRALGKLLEARRPPLLFAKDDDDGDKVREWESKKQWERGGVPAGLVKGKVLIILGTRDPVVVKNEMIADACEAFGGLGFEAIPIECGHEVPFAKGDEVADEFCSLLELEGRPAGLTAITDVKGSFPRHWCFPGLNREV